jgi:hypothetical protein
MKFRDIPIPQINIDRESIQYEVRPSSENVDQFNELEPCEREESAFFNSEVVFGDGTTLEIKEGKILLKVEEKNTLSLKDNFEIEVFEVVDLKETPVSTTNTEFLVPLKFLKEEKQIQNNLLVEPDTEILDSLDKVNNGFVS